MQVISCNELGTAPMFFFSFHVIRCVINASTMNFNVYTLSESTVHVCTCLIIFSESSAWLINEYFNINSDRKEERHCIEWHVLGAHWCVDVVTSWNWCSLWLLRSHYQFMATLSLSISHIVSNIFEKCILIAHSAVSRSNIPPSWSDCRLIIVCRSVVGRCRNTGI